MRRMGRTFSPSFECARVHRPSNSASSFRDTGVSSTRDMRVSGVNRWNFLLSSSWFCTATIVSATDHPTHSR